MAKLAKLDKLVEAGRADKASRVAGARLCLAFFSIAAASYACSNGDTLHPQEPVQPAAEVTPYPEDPALAEGGKSATPGAGEGAAEDSAAGSPQAETKAADQAVGELTNDAFKGSHAAGAGGVGGAPPSPETAEPEVDDGAQAAVQGAFSDNTPTYTPLPGELPPEEAPSAPARHGAKHGKAQASTQHTVRYVAAQRLNVHSQPSATAKVVKQLKIGAAVHVIDTRMTGWTRIGTDEWVRTRFLTKQRPAQSK